PFFTSLPIKVLVVAGFQFFFCSKTFLISLLVTLSCAHTTRITSHSESVSLEATSVFIISPLTNLHALSNYITLVYNCNRFLSSLYSSLTTVIASLYGLVSVLFTDSNHHEGGNPLRAGDQGFADLCRPACLYHHTNYSDAFMASHIID